VKNFGFGLKALIGHRTVAGAGVNGLRQHLADAPPLPMVGGELNVGWAL
jgi:hypothetical protein